MCCLLLQAAASSVPLLQHLATRLEAAQSAAAERFSSLSSRATTMLGRVEVLLGEVVEAAGREPGGVEDIMAAGAAWEAKLAALARRIKKITKVGLWVLVVGPGLVELECCSFDLTF